MLDVIIALSCPLVASVLIFGFYPLFLALLAAGTAVLTEFLYCKARKKPSTVDDLSAVVTGLILALCLPPVVPFYVPMVGAVFAIAIVKMLFGGIGRNFANPAASGRIFLMLCWPLIMNSFLAPVKLGDGFASLFDNFKYIVTFDIAATTTATTAATPLASLGNADWLKLFLGDIAGSAGEVSAIAILIGCIYLIVRKVIDWKTPLVTVLSAAVFSLAFYQDIEYVLPSLLSGGLLFGAVYMATDYATSPNTAVGTIIYAAGIGMTTMIIRKFGSPAEGMALAIVLMNIATPLLDKYIKPRPFGYRKEKKPKLRKAKEANA
jgi:electron transport complex protein RnfD